jgi:hypothetical protein
MSEQIPCVKVTRPDTHGPQFGCVYRLKEFSAADEFDGAEEGESVTLTLIFMVEDDVKNLPEFEGW